MENFVMAQSTVHTVQGVKSIFRGHFLPVADWNKCQYPWGWDWRLPLWGRGGGSQRASQHMQTSNGCRNAGRVKALGDGGKRYWN